MALNLTGFEKALAALERSLVIYQQKTFPAEHEEIITAGVIQTFETCYEVSWKMIKRWLSHNFGSSYVDGVSRRELYRLAAESQLIISVDDWMRFHSARNQTSHTYSGEVAAEVAATAQPYYIAAKALHVTMAAKND